MSAEDREDFERQKESLFVLDELSRDAMNQEDYNPDHDDRAPSHLLFDLHESEDKDMRDAKIRGDIPAGYPTPEFLEEYMTDDDADGIRSIDYETFTSEPDVVSLLSPRSIIIEIDAPPEDDGMADPAIEKSHPDELS